LGKLIEQGALETRYDVQEREEAEAAGRMWNAAVKIGDFDKPEVKAALGAAISVLTADHYRVPATKWRRKDGKVEEILDGILTRHPVEADKHGFAVSYGVSRGRKSHTGTDGVKKRHAPRLKDQIDTIHVFAVDVDGTEKVKAVRDRLAEAGYLAVIYTTHSHAKKKTATGDRFRVLIFFEEPFVLPHPSDNARKLPKEQQKERTAAVREYEEIYVGITEEILSLSDFDVSGANLNQIQHPPRRPTDDVEYFHYVIAGELLATQDAPRGDPSKYRRKRHRISGNHADLTGRKTGEPAILSDGFDSLAWWEDFGELVSVEVLLDMFGWPTRGGAGDGVAILCPNDANHSNPGDEDDVGCWAKGDGDGEERIVIACQHDHCRGVYTWDHIKLMDDAIIAGEAFLPDGYATLSAVLCDPSLYPDDVGDEEIEPPHPTDYGVVEEIEIGYLGSPQAVKRAFKAVVEYDHATDDHFAALYASVAKGGNKAKALGKLEELMQGVKDRFNHNERERLKKRGKELLNGDKAAYAAQKAEDDRRDAAEAIRKEELAHESMDPTAPLGSNLREALATLGKRFVPVDVNGKFRVMRKPDLGAFGSDVDATAVFYQKQDFIDLHLDRQITSTNAQGETTTVNPAKMFIEIEPRKSGVVFAPPPVRVSPSVLNIYQGRRTAAKMGAWDTLHEFIFMVVCKGDQGKFDWLVLWMAHMVQYPGEKPGTAVVCRGEGRTGKGTFGAILSALAAPHVKELSHEAHVTGQFAGEHLSKCILAIATEAVFGSDRRVANILKALVTQVTMEVEAKGMNLQTVNSYLRLYIDANGPTPVLIEGNGSEERYFVLEISTIHKADTDYFAKVYAAIDGEEMAALLAYLEAYDPASAGLRWANVRLAPDSPERRLMAVSSMRSAKRVFLEILREGAVSLRYEGEFVTFSGGGASGKTDGLRVPRQAFKEYISAAGDRREAGDSDVAAMFKSVFPDLELGEGRGRVMVGGTAHDAIRFWQFPAGCLGDANVAAALALNGEDDGSGDDH